MDTIRNLRRVIQIRIRSFLIYTLIISSYCFTANCAEVPEKIQDVKKIIDEISRCMSSYHQFNGRFPYSFAELNNSIFEMKSITIRYNTAESRELGVIKDVEIYLLSKDIYGHSYDIRDNFGIFVRFKASDKQKENIILCSDLSIGIIYKIYSGPPIILDQFAGRLGSAQTGKYTSKSGMITWIHLDESNSTPDK